MKNLSLLIVLLYLLSSGFVFADITLTPTGGDPYLPTSTSCDSTQSCFDLFVNYTHNNYHYYKTGLHHISGNKLRVEYDNTAGYGKRFNDAIITVNSDDCGYREYSNPSYLACGVPCNSSTSCAVHAVSTCASGIMNDYTYFSFGNYEYICGDFIDCEVDCGNVDVGVQHFSNVKGDKGEQGVKGQDGIDGVNGIDGQDGIDGEKGNSFKYEDFSAANLASLKGQDGVDGVDGVDGQDGIDGSNGIDGNNGVDGFSGVNGQDGIDGNNGLDGGTCTVSRDGSITTIDCPNGSSSISESVIKAQINDELKAQFCFITSVNELSNTTIYTCPDGIEIVQVKDGEDGKDFQYSDFTVAQLDGLTGVQGIQGVSGTDGIDGIDGDDGDDGEDGLTGAKGIQGVSGTDGDDVGTEAVVDAIENLTAVFTDGSHLPSDSYVVPEFYHSVFADHKEYEDKTVVVQDNILLENQTFMQTVKDKFSFTVSAHGYESKYLELGKWGSHDISLARFAAFFGGIGNIIYFLASLTALTIVLGGIKL